MQCKRDWRSKALRANSAVWRHSSARLRSTAPVRPQERSVLGRDLSTFDTIERAYGYLEAIDVHTGEFDSFDSDGYRLELLTSGYAVVGAKRLDEQEPVREEVRARLRSYLSAVGDPAGSAEATLELPALISAAARWSRE